MKRRLADGVEVVDLGDESMLYEAGRDWTHVLNPTGRAILRGHLDELTMEEIEQSLKETFRLEPNHDVREEIVRFLGELESKGLLERAP